MPGDTQGTAKGKRPARKTKPGAKPRSRSGCLTCKAKHVKCDETRPHCRMCAKKGWKCGGYSRELKWSYKHQPDPVDSIVTEHIDQFGESTREFFEKALEPHALSRSIVDLDEPSQTSDDFWSAQLDGDQLDQNFLDQDGLFADQSDSLVGLSTFDSEELERMVSDSSMEAAKYLLQATGFASGPDTTLVLMSSWFDRVCPAWSAFDSAMNLNRKLATDYWHSSASVFNSLQSMSASFLSARLPQMKQPALSLMKTATLCIQAESAAVRAQPVLDAIPAGLLFSLFCLGTTVCWVDASFLGKPFLDEAKWLLRRLGQQFIVTSDEDREILAFFEKSLIYWEMLLAVSGPEGLSLEDNDKIYISGRDGATIDDLPHPWTGISTHTSELFSRSIRLCRTFRYSISGRPMHGRKQPATPMQYVMRAQRLEEELLALDFSTIVQIKETGDERTPWLHLARVAEAYQLSSLLQLYETFPDLVSLRLPLDSALEEDGQVPWEKWIIPLSLRLIEVLKHIPPDSGSRVIQPLLYICASTALRYNKTGDGTSSSGSSSPSSTRARQTKAPPTPSRGGSDLLGYIGLIEEDHASPTDDFHPGAVPQMAIAISDARSFVMGRLNILESTLQPKPVMVAKDLVKAVWAAYDAEMPGQNSVHWLDLMESNGDLRSLFG